MDYYILYFGIGLGYVLGSRRFKEHRKTQKTIQKAFLKACLLLLCMLFFPIFIFLNIVSYAKSKKKRY